MPWLVALQKRLCAIDQISSTSLVQVSATRMKALAAFKKVHSNLDNINALLDMHMPVLAIVAEDSWRVYCQRHHIPELSECFAVPVLQMQLQSVLRTCHSGY